MINILIAVTVWTLIIMSGEPLDELYFSFWIHGWFLFTTFVFALLLDFEDWVYVLLKAPWWIWMTLFTFEELDDWFPPGSPYDFFNLIFSSIVIFILLAIDYKSLFLKLINTGSQFFNKNYKKFKKSQSANNFQPIKFQTLPKLYTHPKQIKWLVMLSILLIVFVVGFLIIFVSLISNEFYIVTVSVNVCVSVSKSFSFFSLLFFFTHYFLCFFLKKIFP